MPGPYVPPPPETCADSLQLYRTAFNQAALTIDKMRQVTDTAVINKMNETFTRMHEDYTSLAARHFGGMLLGGLFFAVVMFFLIRKGRRIRAHYEALVSTVNLLVPEHEKLQTKLAEYDGDFTPAPLVVKSTASLWPRFYTRIVLGAFLGFILVYFVVAF